MMKKPMEVIKYKNKTLLFIKNSFLEGMANLPKYFTIGLDMKQA